MPPARPPEQIIRDWLERNGSARVGPDAFAQTWGLDRLEVSDRRRIAAALDRAGVDIDPPLQRASHSEKVMLSIREVEPEPAPEPDPEPAREREPAPRPSAPTPPPQPRPTPGRPGVRHRAGRRARALLDRKPPAAPPQRPAPAPSSTTREEALRRDTAREQARAERERERERLGVEAAERVELKRREREEAEAAARDERERALAEAEERAEAERERDRQTAEAEYRRERERARSEAAAAEPEPDPDSEADIDPEPSGAPVSRTTIGVIVAAVVLMILGALGPWAKAVFVVDYGVDRHGVFVIAAALITAVLLAIHLRRRRESWLPLIAASAAAFSAAVVAGDFRDLVDDPFVGPTWGIYAAFLGSVGAVVVSMALLVRRR